MSKHFLITLATILLIVLAAGIGVFLAKGYTFSPKIGKVNGSGIISVTSVPDGASVYIDGHLVTATNATVSQLTPKSYQVKVVKEGFIPWEKAVTVSEGLVNELKVSLFPSIPTIYPLTYNGVASPILSPDGEKLAFSVPLTEDPQSRQKGGVWVWTMSSQPISFNRGGQPQQLVASAPGFDFSKAKLQWSPDSKQVLVSLQQGDKAGEVNQRNFLLTVNQRTQVPDLRDVTPTLTSLLKDWQEEEKAKTMVAVAAISDLTVRKIASEAGVLRWSPDETKFMVSEKAIGNLDKETKSSGVWKVYDLGLEKGSSVKVFDLPQALSYYWLPDSRHVILVQKDKLEVVEFDGNNAAPVFMGSFDPQFVFPWPDSSRLVILSSYPAAVTPSPSEPGNRLNLFGVNLK